jgi:hypothetical protein
MRTTVSLLGRVCPAPLDDATRDNLVDLYERWRAG